MHHAHEGGMIAGPSSAANSGKNTPSASAAGGPASSSSSSSYYPAFAIDALTGLSDPGAWTGVMAASAAAVGIPPAPAATSSSNGTAELQNGVAPTAVNGRNSVDPFADPVQVTSPSRRGLVRKQSDAGGHGVSESQVGTAAAAVPPPSSASGSGSNARAKKRQRSTTATATATATANRNEREGSASSRSGTGDAGGDDGTGGIPAGTPAGNGMVYAANGEIISHEEE
jgi:hypothetical protein